MDGIAMSMDGIANIAGTTWWHKSGNGKHFTIRDVVSDGSEMIAYTTTNDMIPITTLDNYIQSDTPIGKLPEVNPNIPKINLGNLDVETPLEPVDDMLSENPALLVGLNVAETPKAIQQPQQQTNTNNYDIIDKAFSKVERPVLEFKLIWDKFPAREVEMLVDIMDVPEDDIADYVFNKYFKDHISEDAKSSISDAFVHKRKNK